MRKKVFVIIALIAIGLSGCIGTKIYLDERLGGGQDKPLAEGTIMSRAIDPTTIPAGGTWGTVRGILNSNFSNIDGTLDSVEAAIQLRLLISDTATMLAPYALTSELSEAGTSIGDVRDEIADSLNVLRPLYVAVADTASMLSPYALTSEVGESTLVIGDVRDEIADSLNVLRPIVVMVADTATMLSPYILDSEARGAISDSISDLISGGTELSDVAVMLTDSLTQWVTVSQLSDSLAAFSGGISEGTVAGMINDSIQARLDDAVAGVPLADSLTTYVTPTQLVDSLEAIAGGLVIGDVRDEIADSLNVLRADLITIADVQDEIADSLNALRPDILSEADLRKYDSDTIPLFIFGGGSGQTADTAIFNDNAIMGAFYNAGSDTLHITSLRGVLAEGTGTGTIGVQISWHGTFKSGSATNINSSALTITSITTGDSDTSFDNNDIPPNVWVWCTISGTSAGNRPSMLILTMTGYKRNRSY